MSGYTFQSLSDADFEDLVGDLLGASLGVRFQCFATGPDGGVDLLHGARIHAGTIVQCKHFWRSGFSKLKSELKSHERPKLAKLSPKRYILATSVGLTPGNKQELADLLTPYCQGLDDIYGCDELNSLLRAHPTVETAHYKLWLTSAPVLQRVLRHGKIVWNALTKSEIERRMCLYVQTDAYRTALDILQQHNYCVISGIPGIGKTTLAQILVARLMDDDFELVAARQNVGEALELLDSDKRQVVYYDDFLGRSSIGERLGKNEDQGILRLLEEARRSKRLKVILTTREYILNDARRHYEPLAGADLDVAKCIVKMQNYTRGHRARILYNHVYFSNLPQEYAGALVKDRAYEQIVDHPNYSPRIVEWMTSGAGMRAVSPDQFVNTFVNMLDDPLRIWEHAFNDQIGDDCRVLLLCLASVTESMAFDDLRTAWVAAVSGTDTPIITRRLRDRFMAAVKQLDGSFVRTERGHQETAVSFHNPSIGDFVARRIAHDIELRQELLASSQFFEQVSCLARLDDNGQVQIDPVADVVGDDAPLREAVRRTVAASSPLLCPVGFGRSEPKLGRWMLNRGGRLSELASWEAVFDGGWLDFVCEVATDQADSGDVVKFATTGACDFLDAVVRQWPPSGGKWSSLVQQYAVAIGHGMEETYSPDEWARWTRFVLANKELFDEKAVQAWRDRAQTFCREEIDAICDNADSTSHAESWFGTVEEIAAAWSFSIDDERHQLQEWIANRESDPEEDEWDGRRGGSRVETAPGGTGRDLDALFSSLIVRDRT